MTGRSALIKVAVGLAAVGLLAVLFLRSAQAAREAPFTAERGGVTPWTLVFEPDALGSWIALRPPAGLAVAAIDENFSRWMPLRGELRGRLSRAD
jgi:hypothetical protein